MLVHKKDPGVSVPSDALGLIEWAMQMLEDYQMGNQVNWMCEDYWLGHFRDYLLK